MCLTEGLIPNGGMDEPPLFALAGKCSKPLRRVPGACTVEDAAILAGGDGGDAPVRITPEGITLGGRLLALHDLYGAPPHPPTGPSNPTPRSHPHTAPLP